MRSGWLYVLFFTLCAAASSAQSVRPLFTRNLPADMRYTTDIRLAGGHDVYVTVAKSGVYRLAVDSTAPPSVVVDASQASGFVSSLLATYDNKFIVGSHFGGGVVKTFGHPNVVRGYEFSSTMDLDARAGKAVLLGATRDVHNKWAPEGAIAWIGDVADTVTRMEPLVYSEAGAGVKPMAVCGAMPLGAVRFIDDHSFVVIPGVERGVFLYRTDKKRMRTWQSGPLGFYDHCDVSSHDEPFLADPAFHDEWINDRVLVDDVIAVPGAIGLILRAFHEGKTTWTMRVLSLAGAPTKTMTLPFVSRSPYTHMKADSDGRTVAFLFAEWGPPKGDPVLPPHVVIAELKP